ncbi:MAG: hypothetical protein KF693_06855 [Nitrospira sp.]|nr:hypothetical protein [Nitrospira sp.]
MSLDTPAGLSIILRQLEELEALANQTLEDLNTVAGTERIMKWKAHTAALISNAVGHQQGTAFAGIQPGPSFTNDMIEEFTDLVACYRVPLLTLAKQLSSSPLSKS